MAKKPRRLWVEVRVEYFIYEHKWQPYLYIEGFDARLPLARGRVARKDALAEGRAILKRGFAFDVAKRLR